MRIDSATLLRLPVVTEDGGRVGHLTGLVIDAERHAIALYRVCPDVCLASFFHLRKKTELLVAPSQVVAIREDAVVVESSLLSVQRLTAGVHAAASPRAPTAVGVGAPTSTRAS